MDYKEAALLAFSNLEERINRAGLDARTTDAIVINSLITYLTCTGRSLEDVLKTTSSVLLLSLNK